MQTCGDLVVWDGHVAMVVGDWMMIEARYQQGLQNAVMASPRPYFICPSKPRSPSFGSDPPRPDESCSPTQTPLSP